MQSCSCTLKRTERACDIKEWWGSVGLTAVRGKDHRFAAVCGRGGDGELATVAAGPGVGSE